ncbi:hypothetical protein EVA_17528 [gut metagenome]|uniref:Uncharacterized protein n=1 Tax=gut metagenome TaxID=749906 RepID=J9C3G6_9ZZZZ
MIKPIHYGRNPVYCERKRSNELLRETDTQPIHSPPAPGGIRKVVNFSKSSV